MQDDNQAAWITFPEASNAYSSNVHQLLTDPSYLKFIDQK